MRMLAGIGNAFMDFLAEVWGGLVTVWNYLRGHALLVAVLVAWIVLMAMAASAHPARAQLCSYGCTP